jgi:hypothetical protein
LDEELSLWTPNVKPNVKVASKSTPVVTQTETEESAGEDNDDLPF